MTKKKRDTWLYELKDKNTIVQYGLSNSPDRRCIEHENSRKKFTRFCCVDGILAVNI